MSAQSKSVSHLYTFIFLLVVALSASCQKDERDNSVDKKLNKAVADSSLAAASPGNFLAVTGTLTVTVQDSTYTFDASKDSIAFVNMRVGDNPYFGITAINRAHTMSFAISSRGVAASALDKGVEGGQLLLRRDAIHIRQYSLAQFTAPGDAGVIQLHKYRQDSVLATGKFFTFLSPDDKAGAAVHRAEGSFNLRVK